MTRSDGKVTINGRVHALCRAGIGKPVIYQVFPEHFTPCEDCTVFGDLDAFEQAQIIALFSTGLDKSVVCGVSCEVCRGFKGKMYHIWKGKPPTRAWIFGGRRGPGIGL